MAFPLNQGFPIFRIARAALLAINTVLPYQCGALYTVGAQLLNTLMFLS